MTESSEAWPAPPVTSRRGHLDAVSFLKVFVIIVFLIPGGFVIGALGAAGRPSMLVGLLGLLWWACERVFPTSSFDRRFQPVRLATICFAAAILVSYVAAYARPIDAVESRGADRGLILVFGLVGLTLLAADGITSRKRLDSLLIWVVTGATIIAAVGVLQFFTGFDLARVLRFPGLSVHSGVQGIQERSDLNRVAATASHPIEFGVVLAMAFPLAIHFALHATAHRRWAWARVVLIAMAVPMSVSRSGTLAFGIAFLVMWLSWPVRLKARSLVVGIAGALVMRLFIPGLLGTIKSLFTNLWNDPSTQGRTQDYGVVGDFFAQRPITGRGFATFLPERYITLDNQYLGLLVETGVAGTIAFIALFLVGFGTARGARRGADEETRSLGQALAAACLAAMVVAGTYDLLSFTMSAGLAFLLIGCAGALWRLTAPTRRAADTPAQMLSLAGSPRS